MKNNCKSMRKKALLLLGFIVLSTFLFIQPTKAESEIVELSPVVDIFTEERGFGIQVRDCNYLTTYYWIDGDELRETYIQFNLPIIDNLHSIKLKLTEVGNVNNNITNFPIRVSLVSNNWSGEDNIVWDSKPEEFGIHTIVYLTKDTLDSYYRDYIFNLSDLIENIKEINDTLITFQLSPNDLTVDHAYLNAKSSEYSNISCRPKLILEYGELKPEPIPVPEPEPIPKTDEPELPIIVYVLIFTVLVIVITFIFIINKKYHEKDKEVIKNE